MTRLTVRLSIALPLALLTLVALGSNPTRGGKKGWDTGADTADTGDTADTAAPNDTAAPDDTATDTDDTEAVADPTTASELAGEEGGCGCASTTPASLTWLAGLVPWVTRRRAP